MLESSDLYACTEGLCTSQSRWQWTTLWAASSIDSMLTMLLKKGAFLPKILNLNSLFACTSPICSVR